MAEYKKMKAVANPKAKEYISNKDFTAAIADWIKDNKGKPRKTWSVMPDTVCNGIVKIIDNFALKGRWRGYSYISDMKSDAFLTCLKYIHNFNIEKSTNAFAYITQITKQAFRQFIDKENKQSDIKMKAVNEISQHNYNNINLYHAENEEDYEVPIESIDMVII